MGHFFLIVALGCSGGSAPEPECSGHGDCASGSACIEGACAAVECLTSSFCDLNWYCDDAYVCVEGCQADADCQAGSSCDTSAAVCVVDGCVDTDVDCAYGEFCDTSSGECNDGGYDWCASCPLGSTDACPEGSDCFSVYSTDPTQAFCYPECTSDDECPRGFSCELVEDAYYCKADCPWLVASGYQ